MRSSLLSCTGDGLAVAGRDGRNLLGRVGLLLLTIFRVRYWMIANIP